jgi:hypothetical protein
MNHPTQPVKLGGRTVEIDEEIAPLIEAMDRAGIVTHQSCQNMNGWAWIVLEGIWSLGDLLSAVGEPDEDPASIYQRLTDWEVAAPYWATSEGVPTAVEFG